MFTFAPLFAAFALVDGVSLTGGGRAYFETAYLSSTGNFVYDNPVAEQYFDVTLDFGDYGRVRTDAWIFSDIAGSRQDVHRRGFSCYEGTLVYGYGLALDDERKVVLDTNGGILWDWLGGYKTYQGIPICWYAFQSLRNPYLIPYWNALGGPWTGGKTWARIRFGVQHDWQPIDSLTISPYADITWGDPNRFEKNYGESPDDLYLGGSFMFSMVGVIARWYFLDNWYLWGRYRHMFVVDGKARRLMHDRKNGPRETEFPFLGLGIGFRF